MKFWLAALFLIVSFQSAAFAKAAEHIDLILDIDWTTFYTINPQDSEQRDDKSVEIEGKIYRPTDYLSEMIETLLIKYPRVRISFFSGGEKSRNEALLATQTLSDGRTLKDIAFRLLSKEDLTQVSQDETLKFVGRYKKVLDGKIPDWSPADTILIDDQPGFAKHPLHAVDSLGRQTFQVQFNPQHVGQQYYPNYVAEWRTDRNKALIWLAMIDLALTESQKNNRDFSVVLQEIWPRHAQDSLLIPRGKRLLQTFESRRCDRVFAF